jgi:hypothetical protein
MGFLSVYVAPTRVGKEEREISQCVLSQHMSPCLFCLWDDTHKNKVQRTHKCTPLVRGRGCANKRMLLSLAYFGSGGALAANDLLITCRANRNARPFEPAR